MVQLDYINSRKAHEKSFDPVRMDQGKFPGRGFEDPSKNQTEKGAGEKIYQLEQGSSMNKSSAM